MTSGNENMRLEDEICNKPFNLLEFPQSDDPTDGCHKTACHMVVVHNMFIRYLNSIYLQAEGVEKDGTKDDAQAFLWYASIWWNRLDHHHKLEEARVFPLIREKANNQTLMADAVGQHDGFRNELEAFGEYIVQAMKGEIQYSGAKMKHLIDQFGNNLHKHLGEEILDLAALKGHISGQDMVTITEDIEKDEIKGLKLTEDAPIAQALMRTGPGNEKYAIKLPAVARYLTMYVFWWKHADSWRFLPCDHYGVPKLQLDFYKP